jgi:hypothetical protein
VYFPKDRYIFTAPAFLHANVSVDLGRSTVTNISANATRFVRSNRVFILGILAREDFDRFGTQGWEQTADNITQHSRTITTVSGTMPSIGDTILIRTTASASSPTLPTYTTFNEVIDVSGTTITLKYPMELAVTAPKIVNFSKITTLKSTLVGTGEPHRYYAATNASIKNGTLVSTDGPAYEVNAALNADLDFEIYAKNGQGIYGNGMNRCRIRVRGVCGGPKGPIEIAVGSALTSIEADLWYSGTDTDSSGAVSGSYPAIQIGENTEQIHVRGILNLGNKPTNQGVTTPTANRNNVNVRMVAYGITANVVVFASNSGVGNRVSGHYEVSSAADADYFCLWSAGTGSDNWLENATFLGTASAGSLRFSGPSLGGAHGVKCYSGQLIFDTGALGNIVMDSYIAAGLGSAGPNGSFVQIMRSSGPWPEDTVIVDYTSSGTQLVREVYGRTMRNVGAAAVVTRTLPAAVSGMYTRAVRSNASFALRIDPNGTEIIGTGGAGKYLELQSDRAYVELRCYATGVWTLTDSFGTVGYEA